MQKLKHINQKSKGEVGFMCILEPHPHVPFYVADIALPDQRCTSAEVDWDDAGLAKLFHTLSVAGLSSWQFAQTQGHTHPKGCNSPSGTDEHNFRKYLNPWQFMFIVSKEDKGTPHLVCSRLKLVLKDIPFTAPLSPGFNLKATSDIVINYDVEVEVDVNSIEADNLKLGPDAVASWEKELEDHVKSPVYAHTSYTGYFDYYDRMHKSSGDDGYVKGGGVQFYNSKTGKWEPIRLKAKKKQFPDPQPLPLEYDTSWYISSFAAPGYNPDIKIDPVGKFSLWHELGVPARYRKSGTAERFHPAHGCWLPCAEKLLCHRAPDSLTKSQRKAIVRHATECWTITSGPVPSSPPPTPPLLLPAGTSDAPNLTSWERLLADEIENDIALDGTGTLDPTAVDPTISLEPTESILHSCMDIPDALWEDLVDGKSIPAGDGSSVNYGNAENYFYDQKTGQLMPLSPRSFCGE